MAEKPSVLFLYLNSGGGHKAPATALANWINRHQGHRARAIAANGISRYNVLAEFLLSRVYRFLTTGVPAMWKPFYKMSQPRMQNYGNSLIMVLNSTFHLWNLIRKEKPSVVVACHLLLNFPLKVLRRVFGMKFTILTLCTDPFTIHPFWFWKQYGTVLVFSRIAREEIMATYRIGPERLPVFPWVMQERFSAPLSPSVIPDLKAELGFRANKRLILLSGGAEGLPRTEKYFSALLSSKADFDIAVVAGKNNSIKRRCEEILASRSTEKAVRVFGFTERMYDLVNCSDLVVSKAGTSTVMETLAMGKPLLIAQYLYGQEFGNAMFVVRKGLGDFVPRPRDLLGLVERILAKPALYERYLERIRAAGLTNGTPEVAEYIIKKAGA